MATYPIWKDYYINLGNYESIEYRIVVATNVIYQGKAYRRPDESTIRIKVNDVCADYIATMSVGTQAPTFKIQIKIATEQGGTPAWQDLTNASFKFTYDWSYEYVAERSILSAPILNEVSSKQRILFSCTSASIEQEADYGNYSEIANLQGTASPFGGYLYSIVPEDIDEGIKEITLNGNQTYKVKECDNLEYAIEYRNEYGGYDSLLVEGISNETDNITRYTIKQDTSNQSIGHRNTINTLNELAKVFVLRTGWLTDEQASRMHHLLNATEVSLFILKGGYSLPVVITNSTCEYKTFKNNACQLVNYEIVAELAQDRERR